jgi:hypothetical protein
LNNFTQHLLKILSLLSINTSPENFTFSRYVYTLACRNKIPLTYLELLEHEVKESLPVYYYHRQRFHRALQIIGEVSELFEKNYIDYVVFKTLNPYPEDVADVDFLIMNTEKYHEAIEVLKNELKMKIIGNGPHSTTFLDAKPMFIVRDACYEFKGPFESGRLMVDVYNEIAANYLIYINKHNLREQLETVKLSNNYETKVFKQEADILIRIAHSVIKEGSYNLAAHLALLWYLTNANKESLIRFVTLARENKLTNATRWFLSVFLSICEMAHATIPDKLKRVFLALGEQQIYCDAYKVRILPYKCNLVMLMKILKEKLEDDIFRISMFDQFIHFMNMNFMKESFRRLGL